MTIIKGRIYDVVFEGTYNHSGYIIFTATNRKTGEHIEFALTPNDYLSDALNRIIKIHSDKPTTKLIWHDKEIEKSILDAIRLSPDTRQFYPIFSTNIITDVVDGVPRLVLNFVKSTVVIPAISFNPIETKEDIANALTSISLGYKIGAIKIPMDDPTALISAIKEEIGDREKIEKIENGILVLKDEIAYALLSLRENSQRYFAMFCIEKTEDEEIIEKAKKMASGTEWKMNGD